jgi:hypothetical protein
LVQHPEPQQPCRSAFRPAESQPSTQQAQVQLLHSHPPVSQQPQQSHFGQPPSRLTIAAGTKGTKASADQRIRLFMENPLHWNTELIPPRHDV